MAKLGKDFEEAVYAFVKTLDPTAEVIFDHKVPDRDTGTMRQCDVWVNAKFGGHWPISKHPGEGWVEIQEEDFVMPSNSIVAIIRPKVAQSLRTAMGSREIRLTKPD